MKTISLDIIGDINADPGSTPWAIAVRDEIDSALQDVESSANHLETMIALMDDHEGYKSLGFSSFDEFCEATPPYGLGKSDVDIHIEITNRKIAQERAQGALPLAKPGGDRRSTIFQDKNSYLERGPTASYLTGRIARDRPDILEKMKDGKYRSVRAAAIDAGIIDPSKKRITIAVYDVFLAAAQIRKHFTQSQVIELIKELSNGQL